MKIDKEDFESWLVHPITQMFVKCCGVWEGNARELWMKSSWEAGVNSDTDLARLKGQAEVLRDIQALTLEAIEEALSDEKSEK